MREVVDGNGGLLLFLSTGGAGPYIRRQMSSEVKNTGHTCALRLVSPQAADHPCRRRDGDADAKANMLKV